MSGENADKWSRWLVEGRFGGDKAFAEAYMKPLQRVREAVLDNAKLEAGNVLLDVGAGDGLIAFGALDRVGPAGRVILADISQPLLDRARDLAERAGVVDRCAFVLACAERLDGIAVESVDVVTTRSVLIYVADKPGAFREFRRVLRPQGRLSLFEPINRYIANVEPEDWVCGVAISDVADLVRRLRRFYRGLQPLDTDPMMNFDERDLVTTCEAAGFVDIHLALHILVHPRTPMSWNVFLDASGNPNIPNLREAIATLFSPDEAARYETHVRPVVETGAGVRRDAVAYLAARNPARVDRDSSHHE